MTAPLLSMNPADPPPFYRLDANPFQELCRDLLERQEGIATCEIYGVLGQGQRGVDLKASSVSNDHMEVAQCKCWEEFPPSEIEKASDQFLKHIEFWRKKKVTRFILMVASPLDTIQQQETLDIQRSRFAAEGITYEPWSSRTLRTKLKDHRDIVFRYTRSTEWVEAICGPSIDSGQTSISISGQVSLIESIVLAQLPIYSAGLSKEIADRVERIRNKYREGRRREAYEDLLSLEEGTTWTILDNPLKARILRQRAAYRLDGYADPDGAQALVEQARNLDPEGDDTVIRSFITYYSNGATDALKLIAEPSNTATLNAKVAFLLDLDRSRDAIDQIKTARAINQDVETHRLHALALLAVGNIDQARTTIQVALAREPNWEFVKYSAAVIDYFSCLAPASLPRHLIHWPEPPSWALIKSDDLTRERLRRAEQTFATLCRDTERGEDWLRVLETWRVACIANDASRHDEARDFCRELLTEDNNHYRAFVWAQVRGLDVDFRKSELALREFAASDADLRSRLEAVSTLINFYLLLGKNAEASGLLNKYRSDLSRFGARRNLQLWDIQLMLADGQTQAAIDLAKHERDEGLRRNLMLVSLRNQAETSTDWREYLRYLEKKYRRTKRGDYLFELCSVHAELGQWDYPAEHSKELIEIVQSPTAVRLAASALWRLNKKDKCLKLLNRSTRYFPAKTLPGDLARLRIDCQIATGALVEAVVDATEMLRREASTENLVTLMHAQLSSGDFKGMAISARDLMERQDVEPDTLVRIVRWVYFEDPELAKHLWRRAASAEFSDEALGSLIETGFRLGLDEETAPLLKKAQDSSAEGRGPLRSVSIEDFVAANREQAQQVAELQRDYDRGLFPLHILTNAFNRTLVDLLHALPDRSSKSFDPLRQARIYIRHGGRSINRQLAEASSSWRLCLDVSALIVAAHLGILELIEQTFKPIFISPRLIAALLNQQQRLQTIAPRQIQICTAILDLIGKKRLKVASADSDHNSESSDDIERLLKTMSDVWVSDLCQARAADGFLVDHLPLSTHTLPIKPLELPTELGQLVIGVQAVIYNLGKHGWISPQLVERIKASAKASEMPAIDIPERTSLYLHGNIVESLQELEALEAACDHYEVYVDSVYLDYAKRIIESGEYLGTLTSWLRQLIDRLREGLSKGVYECILPGDVQVEESENDAGFEDAATTRELLGHNLPTGSVLWFDDRHINSYLRSETAPIVGVNEVLAALRHRSLLTDAQYYGKLLQLRAGNYRYIPVSGKEILWHIEKAPIINGEVQETPELRVLRRYIAACFLDKECLQIISPLPGSNNLPGEAPFILGAKRALDEALTMVWKSESKIAKVRANYILNNLYTGSFGIRHLLPNSENRGDATFLLALDIAGIVTTGLLSLGNPLRETSRARQRRLMDWYQNRVMEPRLNADPETAAIAGSTISNFIIHSASETYRTENDRHVSGLINHVLFSELPAQVKENVTLPADVMEWIGHRLVQTVNVANHDIEKDEFAYAVEKLLRGETQVSVKEINEESEFELRRIADGEDRTPVIEVYRRSPSPADKPFWHIKDQFLRIASPDYPERKRALMENRYWFDCDQPTFELQVPSIAGIEDAAARIDQVQQWRIRSAEVYYRELRAKLARTKEFHLADLIPTSSEGLLSHFRLPTEKSSLDDFPRAWEQASRELIATEGLPDALDRITLFPIKTPKCLIDAIVGLSDNESHSLLLDWSKRCLSPLGKVHLADIAIRVGGIAADLLALARGAVSALYDEEAISQFNLLEAFLTFAHERFLQWRGAAGWSDATRLALIWAHSTQLQQIFNSLNADPEKLARILDSFTGGQSAAEVFYRDRTYSDVLHYHRFDRNVFLTHGVSAVLGSHGPEIARELDLKRRIEETAFSEERRKSIIPLLRDPALMTNLTGSFLGGDHIAALSPIMGTDTDGVSSASLKNWISSVLDKSVSDHSTIEWGTIDLVVGDRPIYSDLSDGFWQLIESLDFLKLYKEDDVAALLALRVATDQIIYSDDDDLRARIEDTLLKLLRLSSKDLDTAKKLSLDKRVGALIDAALKLSIKLDNPQASSQRFSQLLHKMLNVSPTMAGYLGPGFVNLMYQLPAAQLHGMWPFLLTIRATSDKPL